MLRVVKAAVSANKSDEGYSPAKRVAYLSKYLIDEGFTAEELLDRFFYELDSQKCIDILERAAEDSGIDLSEVYFDD